MFVGVFVGVNVGVKNDKKWAFPGSFALAGSGYTRFAHGASLTQVSAPRGHYP
jgi:hypothetical protein